MKGAVKSAGVVKPRIGLPLKLKDAKGKFGPRVDALHTAHCREESCGRCKWARLCHTWQAKFVVDSRHPSHGSWLSTRLTRDGTWSVGCKVCAKAGNKGALAEYEVATESGLQSCNFRKHASNPHHKAAALSFIAGSDGDSCIATGENQAPSSTYFVGILESIKNGDAVCGGRKTAKAVWRLHEALKYIDRAFLANAAAISLFRDERKARLAIRFRAVSKNLEVRSGTLGQERNFGTGAKNITTASCNVIRRMCTPLNDCRYNEWGTKAKLDKKLERHFCDHVFMMTVDAAADEVLSAEMMRCRILHGGPDTLLPNLKFVLRDKTHASRRLQHLIVANRFLFCESFKKTVFC